MPHEREQAVRVAENGLDQQGGGGDADSLGQGAFPG